MPAIYTSYIPNPEDDLETRMRKLYLASVSLGEDLYTFNAALNRMAKGYAELDKRQQVIAAEQKSCGEF